MAKSKGKAGASAKDAFTVSGLVQEKLTPRKAVFSTDDRNQPVTKIYIAQTTAKDWEEIEVTVRRIK